ncbi:dihydrofolate synthase / folylpolyglutamate synthase [Desulfosarcina sp. BuS5]|uniref:bifunctional folylpolyglutamate synthase/dihydrofolate synthase n=1 Tax=Desulfosarcina sp. BuS5 TaxID=933262 RepID=UPI0004892335|nr:folylpolyglutamate synthase/dihydrofolate synthase family protein [Desulfosarcina sp. BuS5]WDN88391.1 dihydrofolate synthase / folylpolyglutamate synthase [Desulfosarcina sp. BuS5]
MTEQDIYANCLESMFGLRRFGIKLGLDTIRSILDDLGNPQERFACIHVAGTNGKGSIASAIASILFTSGYKAGLYTSPHLVKFNERISINNKNISDNNVVASYNAVKNADYGTREPTFFEFATAMALYEFGKEEVEWAVIETGMGGRLDATNILNPEISIISNIALEHQFYLGNTIAQIAGEKGGIIKESTPVVSGARQKSAKDVIKDIAKQHSAPLYFSGDDFRIRKTQKGMFSYFGLEKEWHNIRPGLPGEHQIDNAAIVLAVCEILRSNGLDLPFSKIREGLLNTQWPGRLEIVCQSPVVILDGAHNLVASKMLADYLSQNMAGKKITLVVGILDDKPYEDMLRCLIPVCSRVILTQPEIDRSLSPDQLYPVAEKMISDVSMIPDVGEAVKHAVDTVLPDEAVCIAGSLYVVGEAKEALGERFAGGAA